MAKKSILCSSKEDIWQAVRRRGSQIAAELTDKEFFTSGQFTNYATKLLNFLLLKKKLYALNMVYDPARQEVAYTDGKNIFLNTGNSMAAAPKLLERRFRVNMGILFHEAAHKLFLDFDFSNKALNGLRSGSLCGKFDTHNDPELQKAKDELDSLMSSGYGPALAQAYADLGNRLDDGHDEAAMKRYYPGFIRECITVAGEVQMETAKSVSEMIDARWQRYSVLSGLILQYAKYGYYKVGDATKEVEAYLQRMAMLEPIIEAAVAEDSYKKRWDMLNTLVLMVWPELREMFPEPSQQNSGNTAGNGATTGNSQQSTQQPSAEQIAQAMQEMAQALNEAMNTMPAPVNCSGKAVSASTLSQGGAPASGNDCEVLCQEIGQGKAEACVQKELDQAQLDVIRNTNLPLIHKNVRCITDRENAQDKAKYEQIYESVAPYAKSFIKEMSELFREMNTEGVQHHRRFGPIIEANASYRKDGRFFSKKKLPEDMPDIAIVYLQDISGSMRGTKMALSRKAAVLLERVTTDLNIPLMIAGHSVIGGKVKLRIYTDFLSTHKLADRYSLGGMDAGGFTRDGPPIRFCAELLANRPERVKLMIVTSDGTPEDSDYCGEAARKDISDTVKEYRRKGLLIYGAAIDKDRAIIEQIYGSGFLSIQDLASLPRILVRLMRKEILQ